MSYTFPAWSQYLTFPRSSIPPVYPSVKKCSALSWPLDPWPGKCLVKLTVPLLGGSEVCLVISLPAEAPHWTYPHPLTLSPLSPAILLYKNSLSCGRKTLIQRELSSPFFLYFSCCTKCCCPQGSIPITHCHTPLLPVCSTGNLAQAPLIPSDKAK